MSLVEGDAREDAERQAEALQAVRQATQMRWQYMTGLYRALVLKEDL